MTTAGTAPRRRGRLLEAMRGVVAVDRIDRDTVAVAQFIQPLATRVLLVDARPLAGDVPGLDEARRSGVEVAAWQDLARVDARFDVLLAHDYTSPLEPFVTESRRQGRLVAHWADLLLELWTGPVVGVTGSAGKSTTARLVAEMLERAGRDVHTPRSHELTDSANPNWELFPPRASAGADSVLVVELTSSHLEYMTTSPDVGVVTTVSPDHVEWHGTVERYRSAKARILEGQGADGWAILNGDEPFTREHLTARARGRVAYFGRSGSGGSGLFVHGGAVVRRWDGEQEQLLPGADVTLTGPYLMNALAAGAAASALGVGAAQIASCLRAFRGLARRFELVGERDGVRVINDGLALTPRKAIAALTGQRDRSVVLICGGEDFVDGWSVAPMHSSDEERAMLAQLCSLVAAKATHVLVLGPAGSRLVDALRSSGFEHERLECADTIERAIDRALAVAVPGDTVLLAPVFDLGEQALATFSEYARNSIDRRGG